MATRIIAPDDYVLGTHDAEIKRLGVQHRVWRSHMLAAWKHAGIALGDTVIDVGSGPGYVALDLGHHVGPAGAVVALERSQRFADCLRAGASREGLTNIEAIVADVSDYCFDANFADAAWSRWLLSFVASPERVVTQLSRALKPGGTAIFHEYVAYQSWQMLPHSAALARFVELVMHSWRNAGGEPNIALELPAMLERNNMRVEQFRPLVEAANAKMPAWEWLTGFLGTGVARLHELGYLDAAGAADLRAELGRDLGSPGVCMIGPMVMEIIATK